MSMRRLKAGAGLMTMVNNAIVWAKSAYGGARNSDTFDRVERYCMFVGYPRSGHSLVGSLLDAHPNVVLAHELDALAYLGAGFRRNQIYSLILRNDEEFTKAGRLHVTGRGQSKTFDYTVPDQWQGRFDRLSVIGDKRGANSVRRLRKDPGLLDRLANVVGVRVLLIHVVRNPYDNIASMSLRGQRTLTECVDEYFSLCETAALIKRRDDFSMLDVRLEDLIAEPKETLAALCRFLEVEPHPSFLSDCAKVVSPSPHRSRLEVSWTPELIGTVQDRLTDFNFLNGYVYDDVSAAGRADRGPGMSHPGG